LKRINTEARTAQASNLILKLGGDIYREKKDVQDEKA